MNEKEISEVVNDLIENLEALSESVPFILAIVTNLASKLTNAHAEYLDKYGHITDQNDERKVYSIPIERQGRVRRLKEQSSSLRTSARLIPRNLLVSYVSEFDCFLGSLLKCIYTKKPELLNDSSRQITYSELLGYCSLEEAKTQVLEKEIESVLRKSHSDQFTTLENKFDIKLRKDLNIWNDFIEITERRNLIVHSNGVVSSQYLKVCKQSGIALEGISLGDHLSVDIEYLTKAYKVIYEISVKLTHVLWRKLFPNERGKADENLNDVCYHLISRNKNTLASYLLEFAISLPKHHNDTIKRMMVINLAQAYKRSEQNDKCKSVLKRFDWSATGYTFKLAVEVLNEDYSKASNLLKTVVNAGDLTEAEILEWPLFNEFRKSNEFLDTFKDLFGKDYAQQEELLKEEFDSHINKILGSENTDPEEQEIPEEQKKVDEVTQEIESDMQIKRG